MIVVLGVAGWVGWKFFTDTTKMFGGTAGGNFIAAFAPSDLTSQDHHVNILITGDSTGDPGHQGADLTDTIMVMSVDTQRHTAALVSIPRDLWVSIPGYGHQKINFAYHWGNTTHFHQTGYPSGGMGLLEKILYTDLGIPVDYYAMVHYAALKNAVNAVGGITVCIHSPDPRGLYDPNIAPIDGGPLKLANGCQTLNGQTALNLARARGDSPYSYGFPLSDFNRTQHQRQIVLALKNKVLSAGVLTNPITLGKVLDAIGNNVHTDLTISQARRIGQLMITIPSNKIQSLSFLSTDVHLVRSYTTTSGLSALIPTAGYADYSNIRAYLQRAGIEPGS